MSLNLSLFGAGNLFENHDACKPPCALPHQFSNIRGFSPTPSSRAADLQNKRVARTAAIAVRVFSLRVSPSSAVSKRLSAAYYLPIRSGRYGRDADRNPGGPRYQIRDLCVNPAFESRRFAARREPRQQAGECVGTSSAGPRPNAVRPYKSGSFAAALQRPVRLSFEVWAGEPQRGEITKPRPKVRRSRWRTEGLGHQNPHRPRAGSPDGRGSARCPSANGFLRDSSQIPPRSHVIDTNAR